MVSHRHPVISACVCCHNASLRITDTLVSLTKQTADPLSYEILVVDNASSDRKILSEVLEKINIEYGAIRLVEENNIGLSIARNRAVAEAVGEYVFFIDDDAIASVSHIQELLNAIETYQPDVLGGNVLPLFEANPPEQMDYSYWPDWSLKHFGSNDRWLNEAEYFLGTNVCAKKSILMRRKFDESLGRRGASLVGGEEWFLGESQYQRRFVAQAYVFHKVTKQRMSMDYLAKRLFGAKQQRNQCINNRWVVNALPKILLAEVRSTLRKIIFRMKLHVLVRHLAKKFSNRK